MYGMSYYKLLYSQDWAHDVLSLSLSWKPLPRNLYKIQRLRQPGLQHLMWLLLDDLTVSQARKYIEEGQFAAGSMLPKVQACVDFASSGTGRTAMITKA